ncbi:MAG: SDR family NAD(P)-dependent oxidoreductase [Acidimicrobiia bacterium]
MPASPRSLTDAAVAVVGASGGLGHALCSDLEARGAQVLRVGHTSGDCAVDVRDPEAGSVIVDAARQRFGLLDGVVIASGRVGFGALADTDPAALEELFLVDALGPLWLAQAVLPALIETCGFLVNISGVVAEAPIANLAAYCAAKAAVSSGFGAMAREVRRHGVLVMDARPPHTETGLATRPMFGTAPRFPEGLAPTAVAARIIDGIASGTAELPAAAFV